MRHSFRVMRYFIRFVNLKGLKSADQIVDRVDKKIKELGPGAFIHGFGWDQTRWDNQDFPTNHMLNHFQNQ